MTLAGKGVLILEDNALIAMELGGLMETAGFQVLGPFATVEEGMELARTRRPDAALLDVHLRGGDCRPMAALLRSMGVPFALVTGYSEVLVVDGAYVHLRKPIAVETVLRTVSEMLALAAL